MLLILSGRDKAPKEIKYWGDAEHGEGQHQQGAVQHVDGRFSQCCTSGIDTQRQVPITRQTKGVEDELEVQKRVGPLENQEEDGVVYAAKTLNEQVWECMWLIVSAWAWCDVEQVYE